jgi:hypothetical protein
VYICVYVCLYLCGDAVCGNLCLWYCVLLLMLIVYSRVLMILVSVVFQCGGGDDAVHVSVRGQLRL